MKFSVLLPTRNGLNYLQYAVESVIKQNYENWEIIISDNASNEDIEGYVRSLNNPRILYSRSDTFLSVTENWNRSIDKFSGDYVIMLGDDDILLQNYFQILLKLIRSKHPDLIYTNAFVYSYPSVHPDFPKGLFHPFGSLNGMPIHDSPFELDLKSRTELVQHLLKFEPVFGTNMQHALIHKSLLEKIKRNHKIFHSPYPDFYAMCALFLNAERFYVYPNELVIIGITPKSHGYYFFNKKEQEGLDFLNISKEIDNIESIQSVLLPATGSMLSYWLGAMELLKKHFPLKKYGLKLNYRLYRKLQTVHVMGRFLANREKYGIEFRQLFKLLSLREKVFLIFPTMFHDTYITLTVRKRKRALVYGKQKMQKLLSKKNLLQVSSFFAKNTPILLQRAYWLTLRIFRYVIKKVYTPASKLLKVLIEKVFKPISNLLGVFLPKTYTALSKASSYLKSTPPVQKKYVMMIINPKENIYSNAREIFEQFIPVDCNKN